jgi:hypothetical protein
MYKTLLALCVAALAGCAANTIPEGLVIESATVAGGLTGTFTQGGQTVRFAAIRGEANDQSVDPGAPPFAVDARWSDLANRSILLSGAEDLLPAATSEEEVDGVTRLQELKLALEGARQLADHPAAAGLTPERTALVDLAEVVSKTTLVHAPEGDVPYACTIAYSHQLSVKWQSVAVLGQHSSVGLWSYKRGTNCLDTAYGYKQSCNHGACANASGMATKCSWASGWRSAAWPVWYAEPSTSTGTVSGACRTTYSLLSGHHVCNDDSYIQVYGIKNNASYPSGTSGGTCNDGSLRASAPGC